MVLSLSSETDISAATQEFFIILWNRKVHYRVTGPSPQSDQSSPYYPILFYFFATVMSDSALCRFLTFHVPNLTSIFLSLSHLSKESVQVRGPSWHFVTSFFLRRGVVSPTPNPPAWETPLVGFPQLFIQTIRSYTPYREAVCSIRNLRTPHTVVTRNPPNI
jgi:hypothetical protein